ncbi:hypothetical protein DFH07DRAFT_767225 [Mycena maculata]|uniref:Zn(2)-C6 fungal-type domain-containing protein n=1 Tax=Mycena maculata TaxID=230809 RepID=A0AAD7K0Q8_9AGAR|nr:hypothetical protein DFH07DRAFT_767225 [Mycena maculata]
MSQSHPPKRKLDNEDPRAKFDHDHWAQLRPFDACHEVALYFDGSFQKLDCDEAIAVFMELKPAFVNYRQAEQAAVGHSDASAVEDYIFQVSVMFRSLEQMYMGFSKDRFAGLKNLFIQREPPSQWLKETFKIPETRTRVINPFDFPPVVFKNLGSSSSVPPPPKKPRVTRPAPEPSSNEDLATEDSPVLRRSTHDPRPPPRGNYCAQNTKVVLETPTTISSKKAGKTHQAEPARESPVPTPKAHEESDDDSIQVIAKPGNYHPVETPGEFDPAAIEKANLHFKGKGSKVLGSLPPVPPIAPTVVAKHLVASVALPAEDTQSLFPCYDCLSRGQICVYSGPGKRCYNCIKSGQMCILRASSHQAMIALDRLEPILATTSRRFNSHLKTITRTGRLVQLHQDLTAMHLQQYVDDLKEFAFEFFQAEKALSTDHFNTRFEDYETQDDLRDLFAAFDITFESALEHFNSVNPVGTILEDETGNAVHLPPQHPSLATPLNRLEKVVLPEAAQAHDEPNDPDADLSMETRDHRSGPSSVLKSIATGPAQVKFGPPRNVPCTESPARPSMLSVVLPPPPNPFATQPRDLSSLGWEASTSPGAIPSPKAEPVNEPIEEVEENDWASGAEPSFGTPHLLS